MDNCSTDQTCEIASAVFDERCQLIRNDINRGHFINFSRCIQFATGKYTAIYHADDVYTRNMVGEQVAFLEAHPEVGVVFTGAYLIDENEKKIGQINLNFLNSDVTILNFIELFKLVLRHYNFLVCPSAMVRSDIYKNEIKTWRNSLFGSSSDLDVWFRIAEKHKVGIIRRQLMHYRISKSQASYSFDRTRTMRAPFLAVMEHYFVKDDITCQLTKEDGDYLKILELADVAKRALNSMSSGNFLGVSAKSEFFWKACKIRLIFINHRAIKAFALMFCLTLSNIFFFRRISQFFIKNIIDN